MVRFLLSELAEACDGRLIRPSDPLERAAVDGVSIDSRSVADGELFVPVIAERDGHDFIDGAVANGAAAYLTSGPLAGSDRAPAVLVDDTGRALTEIGRLARSRLAGPVIGITGSVGKTSVKDLTFAACNAGGAAWASAASFNNELGVPLTLANAPDETEIAVVEMGSRGIGHIAELCGVARPTIGVVTCVALAHSELFGSLEGVALGKGELVEALPASGTAVLNADDPAVLSMVDRTDAAVITFGRAADTEADDRAGVGRVQVGRVTLDRLLRPSFRIESDWGSADLTLRVRGAHMATNAAAAIAAAVAAGVPFSDAVTGIEGAELSPWRMEVTEAANGLLVINDAYNANPTSMRAAMRSLGEMEVDRRVAVVGVMAELGDEGPDEHRAVAAEALEAGLRVIAVGAAEYGDRVEHVADRDQALALLDELGAGDAVLVKGSRVAELEHLAADLLQ